MLVKRIETAVHRLRNTKSSEEVGDIVTSLSDIDRSIIESSYTGVRFLAGVIPILGFLGTVFGISVAITTFTSVLEKAADFNAVKPALKMATYNLGIAFDTTLIALLFSGLILLVNSAIQKREEDLLSAVDEYCIDRFVSRLRVVSSDIAELKEAIQEQTFQIVPAIESHTSSSRQSVSEIIQKIDAVGDSIQPTQPFDVKEQVDSIVEILNANFSDLQEKLQGIIQTQKAPAEELKKVVSQIENLPENLKPLSKLCESLKGIEDLGTTFGNFESALNELKPAIENLSEEMAGKVNEMLFLLLKVNVVGHRIDQMSGDIIKNVNFDRILKNLINVKENQKNG